MSELDPPHMDERRMTELRAELEERARLWLPDWRPRDPEADFAHAVLQIAARLSSEVTRRLDRMPEKTFRGFLHWLAVKAKAPRAARLPIVFGMAPGSEPVLANPGVQLQAEAGNAETVIFETEEAVKIIPGWIAALVGADPGADWFSLPPHGFLDLKEPSSGPDEWRTKSTAPVDATQVHLEPERGLDEQPTLLHHRTRLQYRVTKAEEDIVTIEPRLGSVDASRTPSSDGASGIEAGEALRRVREFEPFGETERNRQAHCLFIGSESILTLKSEARIAITYGGTPFRGDIEWSYFGIKEEGGDPDWWPMGVESSEGGRLVLKKPAGSVETQDVDGLRSLWIRGMVAPGKTDRSAVVTGMRLAVNSQDDDERQACWDLNMPPEPVSDVEALANTAPVVLNTPFYPLGREPRLFDTFYLASSETFSKRGSCVRITFEKPDGGTDAAMVSRIGSSGPLMLFSIGRDGLLHRRPETDRRPEIDRRPETDRSTLDYQPVRPPLTPNGLPRPPVPPTTLDVYQTPRLTAVPRERDTVVAMISHKDVWLWRESQNAAESRWFLAGPLPGGSAPSGEGEPRRSVILLRQGQSKVLCLAVLNGGVIHVGPLAETWETTSQGTWKALKALRHPKEGRKWRLIAPVLDAGNPLQGPDARNGLLAIDDKKCLWLLLEDERVDVSEDVAVADSVAPLGLRRQARRTRSRTREHRDSESEETLVVAQAAEGGVSAWTVGADRKVKQRKRVEDVHVVEAFDWSTEGEDLAIFFVDKAPGATGGLLTRWIPTTSDADVYLPDLHPAEGLTAAPTVMPGRVVVPGRAGLPVVFPYPNGGDGSEGGQVLLERAGRGERGTSGSGSPQISWEYWDGQGWWRIHALEDGTNNLQQSGSVTLQVPEKLSATSVAGRTNHWIRARLVGGDYGVATVIVTPAGGGQTVERSLATVNAPQFFSVEIRYASRLSTLPDHVVTWDGGAFRRQSEANRRESAVVELFTPLHETIARAAAAPLAAESALSREQGREADGDCLGRGDETTESASPSREVTASVVGTRALYLGFEAEIEGRPIRLLFLVEERDLDEAHPLRVEVLRNGRFEPVRSDDGTRGLSESGSLELTLSAPPQATELFGQSARYWLRLSPRVGFEPERWRPKIRAAYVNGTHALARETQRAEVLGSSDGSPGQRVAVARPPLLADSLELRVREPLGEEEREELDRLEKDRVIDDVGGRPGDWVLWKEVDDPDDATGDDRVYSLNEETGEIRFGRDGRTPPAGRDSIVAVRYQRGGGDASNHVAAWSQISLITPLQGVDTVVAPEGAAGGSDAQDPQEVLRFAGANLLMRDRALTLGDLEHMALQYSPRIAQARATADTAGVHVYVAVDGREPRPDASTRRELARFLSERASPMLSERGALDVKAPKLVPIRIELQLTITSIEASGSVAKEATSRIEDLLHPARGGLDRSGWGLGAVPTEADVVASMDGIEGLDGVKALAVQTMGSQGVLEHLPATLRPQELVRLVPDGVVVKFELARVEAPA